MYYGQHTQTDKLTGACTTVEEVIECASIQGWEDSEWVLKEVLLTSKGNFSAEAVFPCTYYSHYGEDYFQCDLTSNRPDALCPFHAGEED